MALFVITSLYICTVYACAELHNPNQHYSWKHFQMSLLHTPQNCSLILGYERFKMSILALFVLGIT